MDTDPNQTQNPQNPQTPQTPSNPPGGSGDQVGGNIPDADPDTIHKNA